MLLAFINFINLFFWVLWALRMHNKEARKRWVLKKWLLGSGLEYHARERQCLERFAEQFKMGTLLLFYYIEAHTDRVVARTFANQIYVEWYMQVQTNANSYIPCSPCVTAPNTPAVELNEIGWANYYRQGSRQPPTAPAPPYQTPSPETPKRKSKEGVPKKPIIKETKVNGKEKGRNKEEKTPLKKGEAVDEFSSDTDSVTEPLK